MLVNTLTMPDADIAVNVAYENCFTLSVAMTGQGALPAVSPVASTGCAVGTFAAGEPIALSAAPAAGWGVAGWSGTANDAATTVVNALTMPGADASVGVTYSDDPDFVNPRLLMPKVDK